MRVEGQDSPPLACPSWYSLLIVGIELDWRKYFDVCAWVNHDLSRLKFSHSMVIRSIPQVKDFPGPKLSSKNTYSHAPRPMVQIPNLIVGKAA